ncbi:transposable element Tcb1 transposase [Trichonephila clavipes]|nr:transposable element Tcb1 transposase [Trichonephila clavipes]
MDFHMESARYSYHIENIIERHRFSGAGLLVWGGGIILSSRTDLRIQIGTMTGHIYWDVILDQHARLFRGTVGAEFVLMDGNTHPLILQTSQANAFIRRISPIWTGQHSHRT